MFKHSLFLILSSTLLYAAHNIKNQENPLNIVTYAKPLQQIILGYLGTWNKIDSLHKKNQQLVWVAYSPDSRYLACCYDNQSLDIYNLAMGMVIVSTHIGESIPPLSSAALNTIIAGSKLELAALRLFDNNQKVAVVLCDRDKRVSAKATIKQIKIFTKTGVLEQIIEVPKLDSAAVYKSQQYSFPHAYSPCGSKVATGYIDTKGEDIAELTEQELSLYTNLMQLETSENKIHIFSIEPHAHTELLTQTLADHTDKVTRITFSQDGKYMLSGSLDKTIKLWDGSCFEQKETLADLSAASSVLAISPDNNYIVAGSTNQENKSTIEIWHNQADDFAPVKK